MKCRRLYQSDTKGNYNLVFFKSEGMMMPEKIKISISNTSNNAKEEAEIITRQEYEDLDSGTTEDEISFFDDELTMTFEIVKDTKNIFNTKINNIVFKCSENENYFASIFVTERRLINKEYVDVTLFVIDSLSDLEFDTDTDTYYYVKDDHQYIPFKDFGIAKKISDNYATQQEGVAYDLIQRLSILKGELWYKINHGLPLLDKVRSGQVFDSVIINIIMSHPDVTNIVSFSSSITNNHRYQFNAKISTVYNQDIEIGNTY